MQLAFKNDNLGENRQKTLVDIFQECHRNEQ